MDNQFVIFHLAGESYGIPITKVESVLKMQAITTVSHESSFVEGVTNLRGNIIPVIDLRKRFHLPTQKRTKDNRIMVIAMYGKEVGMIVDSVSEVLAINERDVILTPTMTTTVNTIYISNIARIDKRLIILLDLAMVLLTQEQEQLHLLPFAS